jgi:thiol-disulfide isomerase/thioredoxin
MAQVGDRLAPGCNHERASSRPVESRLPAFSGATGWLNSDLLTPAGPRGKVVLVDFWTYTCINWIRTLLYLRAWAETYGPRGLVVVGVHTPEFNIEHDVDSIRRAAREMGVEQCAMVRSEVPRERLCEAPVVSAADAWFLEHAIVGGRCHRSLDIRARQNGDQSRRSVAAATASFNGNRGPRSAHSPGRSPRGSCATVLTSEKVWTFFSIE